MAELWQTVKSAGMRPEGRAWLVAAARDVSKDFVVPVFVNIGIYYGASMHCLREGSPGAFLVGVDIKNWEIKDAKQLNAYYLWEDSMTVHRYFSFNVHLLFLDGVQVYEGIREDIRGWCPKVPIGGMVVLHCHFLPAPRWGAMQAWDEWSADDESEWEIVEAPRPIGAFRRIA